MKKRVGPSLYFANDKVIFDALNQRQVSVALIRELLFERGIIVSSATSKEDLALYFSRLAADYFDHKSIAEKLGRIAKRERITSFDLKDDLPQIQVVQSLSEIAKALQEEGNAASVHAEGDRVVMHVEYEDIDYTRSEFKQVQPRDASIEFARTKDGKYVVRSTQNAYISAAVERVCASLAKLQGKQLTRQAITLESHADPVVRTGFFESLIKGIEGYEFVTVTEAFCFKPKVGDAIKDDDEEEKELEEQPYVERVTLRGQGVNRSFVIDDLYKAGYYIVKVVWQIKSKASLDSNVFELEAQFSNAAACTDFSYQHRCVIICEEGKPTDKKRPPKAEEQEGIFRLVELAASRIYASIQEKL